MAIITSKNYFKDGDAVNAQHMNDMIDTCVNANETSSNTLAIVDNLVQQPNVDNANAVGTPNVTIGVDGRLHFYNLKGETGATGPQGPQGPQGLQGVAGVSVSYNSSTKTLTIISN